MKDFAPPGEVAGQYLGDVLCCPSVCVCVSVCVNKFECCVAFSLCVCPCVCVSVDHGMGHDV